MTFRIAAFALASLSIGSLMLYFFGVGRFSRITPILLAVEIAGLLGLAWWARRRRPDLLRLLALGLWAGSIATVAYDLVRVPLVHSNIPVFKAISYFGTLLWGVDRPTLASEILGWSYHLSNGVSFGLMYAVLVSRPHVVTALLWGMSLEGAMLMTPYAEVFGYSRDARFVAITLGSHAVYGIVLWLALAYRARYRLAILGIPLALALMAGDFHLLYGRSLAPSPPPYIGSHLYTTWNTPEPDRLAVLWLMKRVVDPDAEFHFVEPFDKLRFGKAFDLPEAEIRRRGRLSATEELVRLHDVPLNDRTALLVRTTHLAEVSRWMLIGDSEATREVEYLRGVAARHCGQKLHARCLEPLFATLDVHYAAGVKQSSLVFVATAAGNWELFLWRTGDTRATRLTSTALDERAPALSPDGRTVVYATSDGALWSMDLATRQPTRLKVPAGIYGYPAWTPDGKRIVYTSYEYRPPHEDADFFAYDVATGGVAPFLLQTGPQDHIAISPSGDRAAYMSSVATTVPGFGSTVTQQLWVVDTESGAPSPLLADQARNTRPAWSPDGKSIAFSSDRSGTPAIWIADPSARAAPMQLTTGATAKSSPAWSPDGSQIAYVSAAENTSAIEIIDVKTKAVRKLDLFTEPVEIRDLHWR